jgi:hypothetical protein
MKNPKTGVEMQITKEKRTILFRGEEVEYTHVGFTSIDGDSYTTTEQDTINMENVLREYDDMTQNKSSFKTYLIYVLLIIVIIGVLTA